MNKKKLISAIRKAIREKNITLACKLIPVKTYSAKYGWVRDYISKERAKKLCFKIIELSNRIYNQKGGNI